MCQAQDGRGVLMYFDPYLEEPSLRYLTAPERARRLTRSLSVSASDTDTAIPEFDGEVIDEQYQRFLQLGDIYG